MKKILCFIGIFLLVGCSTPDLTGDWADPQGSTRLHFEGDQVVFINSEGTYDIDGDTLILTFNQRELIFQYVLEDDTLTLTINDSQIVLNRQ